jgi:hypothetical protein
VDGSKRLRNCCFIAKVLGIAPTETAMCLARSLAELSGCWTWGMLSTTMAEGGLWMVG